MGEEQFLAMQVSDSLHQTFVFGSSRVHARAGGGDRGISSERKRFDVIAPSSSRGCKKVHSLFSSCASATDNAEGPGAYTAGGNVTDGLNDERRVRALVLHNDGTRAVPLITQKQSE